MLLLRPGPFADSGLSFILNIQEMKFTFDLHGFIIKFEKGRCYEYHISKRRKGRTDF